MTKIVFEKCKVEFYPAGKPEETSLMHAISPTDGEIFLRSDGDFEIYNTKNLLHCSDGPALKVGNELYFYYKGKKHRSDGPAYINTATGEVQYWIHGEKVTPEKYYELDKPKTDQIKLVPDWQYIYNPRGCMCPPGSEQTCQGMACPRKSAFVWGPYVSTGDVPYKYEPNTSGIKYEANPTTVTYVMNNTTGIEK